jgi:hypothetical protein
MIANSKADCMTKLLANRCVLFLCSSIVLAGCAQPLAPSLPAQQPAINHSLLDAQATARIQKAIPNLTPPVQAQACLAAPDAPKPKDKAPVPMPAKAPDLTGQLADSLMLVFKTFTGH